MDFILIVKEFLNVLSKFLYAPLMFPDLLWLILAAALIIIITELYFLRYPRESVSHHKAMEGTIYLIFICVDLLRYGVTYNLSMIKLIIIVIFIITAIILCMLDFYHKLPLSIFFRLPSKFMIAFTSYVIATLIYSDLLISLEIGHVIMVLLSIALLYFLIVSLRLLFISLEPRSYVEIEHYLKKVEDEIRKASTDTKNEFSAPSKKNKNKRIQKNKK